MADSALQTVEQYQQLLGSGSDAWTDLITNDVSFVGPAMQVQGKQELVELNREFSKFIKGYESISSFEQGEMALLEGVFTLQAPSGKTIQLQMAEVYKVEQGKIRSIRIYYDAEEFRREFS
jgi:limonene-1,2-epoxide hydrolase